MQVSDARIFLYKTIYKVTDGLHDDILFNVWSAKSFWDVQYRVSDLKYIVSYMFDHDTTTTSSISYQRKGKHSIYRPINRDSAVQLVVFQLT